MYGVMNTTTQEEVGPFASPEEAGTWVRTNMLDVNSVQLVRWVL